MRRLLIVSIFVLSTLLIFLVVLMFRPTYRYPSQGCGVTGCGVPQQSLGASIWKELTNGVGRTQSMR
jgi:hypothetical protein